MPAENVHPLDGAVLGLESFPTPGHASHHVCYLDPDGTLTLGDEVCTPDSSRFWPADEYEPGLNVRFMGINTKAIASYLISLYCSVAVLTDHLLMNGIGLSAA